MKKALMSVLILAIVLAVGAAAAIQVGFDSHISQRISYEPLPVPIPDDEASILEGMRLAQVRGCYDCHGENLAGRLFADAGPVGRYSGSNLTPAGVGASYTDIDWVRAIRFGIAKDGRKLIFMPSTEFAQLTSEDLGKIIAYIKTVPAATNENPPLEVGPLGKVLYFAGQFPMMFQADLVDRAQSAPDSLTPSTSAEYGRYIASSCTGCHGPDYKGGPIPGVPPEWPPAADLTSEMSAKSWTREQFALMLKSGETPNGKKINPMFMPWTAYSAMNDTEVEALHNFIKTL